MSHNFITFILLVFQYYRHQLPKKSGQAIVISKLAFASLENTIGITDVDLLIGHLPF